MEKRGRPKKHHSTRERIKAHRENKNKTGQRLEIFTPNKERRILEALAVTLNTSHSETITNILKKEVRTAITPPFPTSRPIQHIISISGGKDSLATLLVAKEMLGDNFTAIFCDTGNEHPITYDYIKYMSEKIHPIQFYKADFSEQIAKKKIFVANHWEKKGVSKKIIKSALEVLNSTGNPFLDLCIWKGRFPSTRARFCTQELKRKVSENQVIKPLLKKGFAVCVWVGIRADESQARSKLGHWYKEAENIFIYRPILRWSAERVFKIHDEYNIKPNSLYKMGCKRVGCMPCLHSGKDELMNIANRFPEVIERLKKWERIASKSSKRGKTTFFSYGKIPTNTKENGEIELPTVEKVVQWARTGKGGRKLDTSRLPQESSKCTSVYGLCD